jgi:hypothetical protein
VPADDTRYQGRRSEEPGPQPIDPSVGPPGARSEYDLVHVRARPWPERPHTAGLLGADFEFLGLALSLEAARARRRALDRHGITIHIVPVRYREEALAPREAVRRAQLALATPGLSRPPGPPRLLAEHPMLYLFEVPDPEVAGSPAEAGPSPTGPAGVASIRLLAVDRCDGHVWTEDEVAAYFTLVGPR